MSLTAISATLYVLTMTIISQRGEHDVPNLILGIARVLDESSNGIKVVDSFKVSGEAKVVAVIEVSNITGLEYVMGRVWQLGEIGVNCQPVIDMRSFTQNIGVSDNLTTSITIRGTLHKDNLFWEEIDVEYYGKSTYQFLAIWKKHAEAVLTMRQKGLIRIEFYKALAVRKVHVFLNIPFPAEYDKLFLQLPFLRDNGANIHVNMKGVQFLKDYTASLPTRMITDRWI